MRAVLDTNVVVSALIWGGKPFKFIQAAAEGDLLLYPSAELIAELHQVLMREHLALRLKRQRSSVGEVLSLYEKLAIKVIPIEVGRVIAKDEDDDHVIAAAVFAKVQLIVSGDRHLLNLRNHQGIRIVTPAEGLEYISGG